MTHPPTTDPARDIAQLRARIDAADDALLRLWRQRTEWSREVGRLRIGGGGTRLALGREQEIVARFRAALGPDGVALALLLLRAGRGPL